MTTQALALAAAAALAPLALPAVAADAFQRTFVIGNGGPDKAERFDGLTAFADKVRCVQPGDRVLLEGGRTFQGALRLRVCAEAAAGSGTIEIRSFDPKVPDNIEAVRNPARIDAAVALKDLNLDWKPVAQRPTAIPAPPAGHVLLGAGPVPGGTVVEVFHGNARLLTARAPNDPGKDNAGRFFEAGDFSDAAKGCRAATCLRADTPDARAALAAVQADKSGTALAVVRSSPWSLAASPIDAIDAATGELRTARALTGSGMPAATLPPAGSGFALLNSPALLDAAGEWYYDRATKMLYIVWPESKPVPTDAETELTRLDERPRDPATHADAALAFWGGERASSGTYTLRIAQLTVVRSASHAVRIVRAPNVEVSRLRINQPGLSGLYATEASGHVLVERSTIYNAADNGLLVTSSPEITIRGNTITDAGQVANQRQFGMDFNGVRAAGFARALVTDNEVAGVGFAAIMLAEPGPAEPNASSVKIEVSKNRISAFCNLLNDCGAIYINGRQKKEAPAQVGPNSDKRIVGNEIKAPRGNLDGTPAGARSLAVKRQVKSGSYVRMIGAVYLDHQASGYDIADNRIAGLYEPYGWKIFNKGVLNSCSRSATDGCAGKNATACQNDALDQCNSVPPARDNRR